MIQIMILVASNHNDPDDNNNDNKYSTKTPTTLTLPTTIRTIHTHINTTVKDNKQIIIVIHLVVYVFQTPQR